MQRRDPKSIKVHSSIPDHIQSMESYEFEEKMPELQVQINFSGNHASTFEPWKKEKFESVSEAIIDENVERNGQMIDEIDNDIQKRCRQVYDLRRRSFLAFNENNCQENLLLTLFLEKDSSYQKIHVPNLIKLEIGSFQFIQNLDVSSSSFGIAAVKTLCADFSFRNLKFLNLSENLLGNDGIMYLASNSHWTELQTLILQKVEIDYQGAKHLGMNESWKALIELDLSQNPLIGDLGAMSLSLNKSWTNLERLILGDCNIQALGIKCIERNKNLRGLVATNFMHTTNKDEKNQEIVLRKFSGISVLGENKMMKEALKIGSHSNKSEKTFLANYLHLLNKHPQVFKGHLRGGFPQEESEGAPQPVYSELLAKFRLYEERVFRDTLFEKESRLYIETCGSSYTHFENCDQYNRDDFEGSETFDLAFNIRRYFLNSSRKPEPKILLLYGKEGIGKSFFCKKFQRDLLNEWRDPLYQDPSETQWFPIYVDLSSLKNPKSDVVSEALTRELSLTPKEIILLQNSGPNDAQFPNILFIFDGYENILDFDSLCTLKADQDFAKSNFLLLNKIESTGWRNAKFMLTSREMNLPEIKQRKFLFAPLRAETFGLHPISESFLQRKIAPFSDSQITRYLIKTFHFKMIDELEKSEKTSSILLPSDSPSFPLCGLAGKLEKMIDNYSLRELARTPFMLWIMAGILLEIASEDPERDEEDVTRPKTLSRRFLIECFVNKIIKSVATNKTPCNSNIPKRKRYKEGEKLYQRVREMIFQIKKYALELSNVTKEDETKPEVAAENNEDASSLRKLYPIILPDTSSTVRFRCPLLLEFFVAKSIEEEILDIDAAIDDPEEEIADEYILNRKYLTHEVRYDPVFLFLFEALKDEKLEAGQLVNLIRFLTKNKQTSHKKKKMKETGPLKIKTEFAIAVTNAITLLNAAQYDFRNIDFSDICIPGAKLSCGKFEGTKFTRANLKGVDFRGAWLKDANLVMANLQDAIFENRGKYREPLTFCSSLYDKKRIKTKEVSRRVHYILDSVRGHVISILNPHHIPSEGGNSQSRFCSFSDRPDPTLLSIEGGNEKGLNVAGAIVNGAIGLPKYYNVFKKESGYGKFDYSLSRKLFPSKVQYSKKVKELELQGKNLNEADAKIFGSDLLWVNLETIRLANNRIGDQGISVISKNKTWTNLQLLNLENNSISADGAAHLSANTTWSKLQALYLGNNCISDKGSAMLSKIKTWAKLEDLDLQNNSIGDEGTVALGNNTTWPNLQKLNLSNNLISDQGATGLRKNKVWTKLQTLQLTGNSIRRKGAAELGKNVTWVNLVSLDLGSNWFGPEGAAELAKNSSWKKLKTLNLEKNFIGDKGSAGLAKNKSWTELETLKLGLNSIGAEGAAGLSQNETWTTLNTLDLDNNWIGNDGAAELAKNKSWINLQVLQLRFNHIESTAADELSANEIWAERKPSIFIS